MKRTIIAALIIAVTAPAAAEELMPLPNRDMALMWEAMRCSAYAKEAGLAEERIRLFGIGLLAGRKLIAKEIAAGEWLDLQEAGIDFIVGTRYEAASNHVFTAISNKVAADPDAKTAEQMTGFRRSLGRLGYAEKNCQVLAAE